MSEKSTRELTVLNTRITRIAEVRFDYKKLEEGEPPEEAIRMALMELLITIARKIGQADFDKPDWFPMEFPMRLTLQSEVVLWDFQLQARLLNRIGLEENQTD